MKKIFVVTVVVLALMSSTALAGPWEDLIAELPTLPFNLDSCIVDGEYGEEHYLDIEISNDGILDGEHGAWCLDLYKNIDCVDDYDVSVGDLLIPGDNPTWDALNWLMNHYDEYVGQMSSDGITPYVLGDVQAAIWLLTTGMPDYQRPDPDGSPDTNPWSKYAWGLSTWGDWTDHDGLNDDGLDAGSDVDNYDEDEYNDDVARAQEIVDDALLYGADYIPNCDDEVLGLILLLFVDGHPEIDVQPLLITVPAPCVTGCTPGFWKNNWDKKDGNAWEGYEGTDLFDTVFGVDVTLRGKGKTTYANATLLQALDANGGEIDALARHATAALLNMSSDCGGDTYPYESIAALIADVQAAVASGEQAINDLHTKLARYNELGCPINQQGECID